MRVSIIACTASAVLLAACDRSPSVEVTNATPDQVAEAVKKSGIASELQQPGKWVVKASMVDIKAPGMPPEQLAMMKQMMANAKPVERCVTADDLKQATALFDKNPASCTFKHYRLSGGKLDGEANCTMGDMKQHMVMKGTYSADTTETTVTSEMSGPTPPGPVTTTMSIKAQRLGPC